MRFTSRLGDREHGPDDHRSTADERHDDRRPVPRERLRTPTLNTRMKREERRHLGRRRHERRDRGRRALVDVGRPHVERHGRDLERRTRPRAGPSRRARAPERPVDPASARAIAGIFVVAVAPYAIAIPYRKNAEANAPSRKYFIAASVGRARPRARSARTARATGSRARGTPRSGRSPRRSASCRSCANSEQRVELAPVPRRSRPK